MRAIFDISTASVDFSMDPVLSGVQNLEIGFRDNGALPAVFSGLSFGWEVILNGEVVDSQSFPSEEQLAYVATYEDYCESCLLFFEPSTVYSLRVWAENNGNQIEVVESFETGPPINYEEIASLVGEIQPLADE